MDKIAKASAASRAAFFLDVQAKRTYSVQDIRAAIFEKRY